MRIAVFQPHLLPLLYYWNRMASVDMFVLLDNAQFTKKSEGGEALQNYTFVKAPDGQKKKVTLAVGHTGNRELINTKPLAPGGMMTFIDDLIKIYRDLPFCQEFLPELYLQARERLPKPILSDVLCDWIFWIQNQLHIETKLTYSSLSGVQGFASDWMLNFCKHYNADTYVCGKAAYDQYLDKKAFEDAGIKVEVQNWTCPEYEQGKFPFIPNLSIADLVCRVGWEKAREIIK